MNDVFENAEPEVEQAPGASDGEYVAPASSDGTSGAVHLQNSQPQAGKKTDVALLRETISKLPARKRLEAIMDCPDVMRVVRSLPAQDLFLTLKEVGPAEALEIVELLHPRQVQVFMDLDGWRKDRIDGEAVGEWLELLYAANPERAVRQIIGLDVELLSLLFKIYTRAFEIIEGEDLPVELDNALTSVTPDYRYVVVYGPAPGRERLLQALRTTVERLFGINLPFVLHLIQAVRWELPSALEEEAFRFRNGRLADLGFGDVSEPGALFAWVDPEGVDPGSSSPDVVSNAASDASFAHKAFEAVDPDDPPLDLSRAVFIPWSLLDAGQHVLGSATQGLPDVAQRRVAHELGQVINRLHLAVGGDLGDPGALIDSSMRVADTIGLALAYSAKGDLTRASSLLLTSPLLTLFRKGHALATRLSTTVRELMAKEGAGLDGQGILRVDPPLREVLAGLLVARPLFYRGLTESARSDYRHFSSLPELAATARAVTEAKMRAALLRASPLAVHDDLIASFGVVDTSSQPTHSALLANAFARSLAGNGCVEQSVEHGEQSAVAPLSDDDVFNLAEEVRKQRDAGGLSDDDREKLRAFVLELVGAAKEQLSNIVDVESRALMWGDRVMDAMTQEILAVTGDIDPRFVQAVWTERTLQASLSTSTTTPESKSESE